MKLNIETTFDSSYERILSKSAESGNFFDAFYEKFINASPIVKDKFKNTDMKRQRAMLEKSLHYVAYLFTNQEIYSYIQEIAELHNRKNLDIRPELYDLWLESLIDTVRDFDSDFDDDVELAWRLSLARGIAYMKYMYAK